MHLRAGRPPLLVREGWSWGACLFGPLWLAARRAFVPAALNLAAAAALLAPPAGPVRGVLWLALLALQGLLGRDAWRWSLARRGYVLAHVVAARDGDAALARLLAARGDLIGRVAA